MFDFVWTIRKVEPVEGVCADLDTMSRNADEDEDKRKAELEEGRQVFPLLQKVVLPQKHLELAPAHTHDVTASTSDSGD